MKTVGRLMQIPCTQTATLSVSHVIPTVQKMSPFTINPACLMSDCKVQPNGCKSAESLKRSVNSIKSIGMGTPYASIISTMLASFGVAS